MCPLKTNSIRVNSRQDTPSSLPESGGHLKMLHKCKKHLFLNALLSWQIKWGEVVGKHHSREVAAGWSWWCPKCCLPVPVHVPAEWDTKPRANPRAGVGLRIMYKAGTKQVTWSMESRMKEQSIGMMKKFPVLRLDLMEGPENPKGVWS